MIWVVFAFLCSLTTAAFISFNHVFRLPANLLMVYRGLGSALCLAPLLLFVLPVTNPMFYLFCILQGCLVAYTDNRIFNASKTWGDDTTAAIKPLSVALTFLLWIFIFPDQLIKYTQNPVSTILIIGCLSGIIFSILKLKKAKTSRAALLALSLPLIGFSITDILNKEAMSNGGQHIIPAVLYYCFITSFICGLLNLFVYLKIPRTESLFNRTYIFKGIFLIILVLLNMGLKNLAMFFTPNPAYVSAIIALFPLWIITNKFIIAHMKNQPYKGHINPGLIVILVACLCGLIVLS